MFGRRLRTLRQSFGLSQIELSEYLNISQQALSKWENNSAQPDNNSLKKLSDKFDVSVDYLLGISDNKNPRYGLYTKTLSDEEGYTIEIKTKIPFNELSQDDKKEIIDVAMENLIEVKKEIREKDAK